MGVVNDIKIKLMELFHLVPAAPNPVTIQEPMTFQTRVMMNKLWYRGDISELQQFFSAVACDKATMSRFWAASARSDLKKIHSGVPKLVVNKFRDIITADLDKITITPAGTQPKEGEVSAIQALWDGEMADQVKFSSVIKSGVQGALSAGDGAWKITMDTELSEYPILEFYTAENIDLIYDKGFLVGINFYTKYLQDNKEYRLKEEYRMGSIHYILYDSYGKEVPLGSVEVLTGLEDFTQTKGDKFLMAVPLIFFESERWKGRGEALMDSKVEALDTLDEVLSQFANNFRQCRPTKYIPEDFLPRDPSTGKVTKASDFDDHFISINSSAAEGVDNKIQVVAPDILHEAYQEGKASYLDDCLCGIISPSSLGIDLKKTDNAEAQREKEKTTLDTRSTLVDVLNETIPLLVNTLLKVYDLSRKKIPQDYEVSVSFGEYSSPSFDTVVEVVGKAVTYGIMSVEKGIDELYGDTMTPEEKEEEIKRIKEAHSTVVDEPLLDDVEE